MIPLICLQKHIGRYIIQVFEESVHYNNVDQWEFDLFSNRGSRSLPSIQNARAF